MAAPERSLLEGRGLEAVLYLIEEALAGNTGQVKNWAMTLVAILEVEGDTISAERINRKLSGQEGNQAALDDVIPQSETIEEMRMRAIASNKQLEVLKELKKLKLKPLPGQIVTGPKGEIIQPNPDGSYTIGYDPYADQRFNN